MENVYKKLNQCKTIAIALGLIDPYAEQFISKSHRFPVPSDLYETSNLDLEYPDFLRKCLDVQLNTSNEDIKIVEEDTRAQAKASSFFFDIGWAGLVPQFVVLLTTPILHSPPSH